MPMRLRLRDSVCVICGPVCRFLWCCASPRGKRAGEAWMYICSGEGEVGSLGRQLWLVRL